MVHGLNGEIKSFRNLEDLSAAAADRIVEIIHEVVSKEGVFSLALSGGSTPKTLYKFLSTTRRDVIPWDRIHIFFGDERYISQDDLQSNFRMARETLLEAVPIPRENVHPIRTNFPDAEKAAVAYEREVREFFPGTENTFTLALLGMGKEGHTASLFPYSPALDETDRWVVPVSTPALPPTRITLTYPPLNSSRNIFFLVAGAGKREALRAAVTPSTDHHLCPSAGIKPSHGDLIWWVDTAAWPSS